MALRRPAHFPRGAQLHQVMPPVPPPQLICALSCVVLPSSVSRVCVGECALCDKFPSPALSPLNSSTLLPSCILPRFPVAAPCQCAIQPPRARFLAAHTTHRGSCVPATGGWACYPSSMRQRTWPESLRLVLVAQRRREPSLAFAGIKPQAPREWCDCNCWKCRTLSLASLLPVLALPLCLQSEAKDYERWSNSGRRRLGVQT